MDVMASVGFFGKLPGVGDFVQRRLPMEFVAVWDRHWQEAVSATHTLLGDQWKPIYLNSPLWRFVLPAGVCTEAAWAGLLGPSVDRVGRCFPMVLAAPLTGDSASQVHFIQGGSPWFAALEQVFKGGQAADRSRVDDFDLLVTGLPDPMESVMANSRLALQATNWDTSEQWRLPLSGDHATSGWLGELWSHLQDKPEFWCQWWTLRGTARVQPKVLLTRGLPRTSAYTEFLDDHVGSDAWSVPDGLEFRVKNPPLPAESEAASGAWEDAVKMEAIPESVGTGEGILDVDARSDPEATGRSPASHGVAVVHREDCGITLLAADEGLPDPHRQATNKVVDIFKAHPCTEKKEWLSTFSAELLTLHPWLADQRRDLVNPVEEEVAIIALRIQEPEGELMRMGCAAAWQWRRGRLLTLHQPAGSEQGKHGLGGDEYPDCARCLLDVEQGDRFLMVATQSVMDQLSEGSIAKALALSSCEEAYAFLADALQPVNGSDQWPIEVIEVKG